MDFDTVADELYGLPPGEFIATRNGAAKQARADGDRQLAEQIRSLRRPSTAAWLANQLVREHREEMEPLLALGRELREVMADLGADDLRALTSQRYRLVSALVKQARGLGAARGARVTDDVAHGLRATLEATLSDADSAEAVAAGRLTDALRVSGFGQVAAAELSGPETRNRGSGGSTVSDLATKRQDKARRLAEREVAEAERAARAAQSDRDSAEDRFRSTSDLREKAAAVVDHLRQQLTDAGAELERRAELEESARRERDAQIVASQEADQQLSAARDRLERLLQ